MKKIYLAHPISNDYEAQASIDTANKLRELGYEVYAAAENKSINDKTKDPTPVDIYDADVAAIMDCDIFIINLTGGDQDGTISELGVICGINEERVKTVKRLWGSGSESEIVDDLIPIIAYTTNARLANPQFFNGVPSARANHLNLGMVAKWTQVERGRLLLGQDELINYMAGGL